MNIKGKKILVTGGAGFIGSHIVDSLVHSGAQVSVFDNLSSGHLENLSEIKDDIQFVKGDILDVESLDQAMKQIDIVSHQAAQLEIFRAAENPHWDLQINTIGSLNVFESAKKAGVSKIINASSACVYGQKNGITREIDPRHPNWAYGVSKLAAEEYGRIYSEHYMPIISLRYSIVYGEREWYRRVLPIFLLRVIQGKAPVVFGDGQQIRDFIYVGDVVNAHNKCIECDEANGEFFNISSGTGVSIVQLANKVSEIFLKGENIIFENVHEGSESALVSGKFRNISELKSMILSSEKAANILQWKPEVNLDEGLRREFEWARKNQHRWQKIFYTDRG